MSEDDDAEDPFERIDPDEREGDPFERLDDIGPSEDQDDAADEEARDPLGADGAERPDDAFSEGWTSPSEASSNVTDAGETDAGDPLTADADAPTDDRGDPFEGADSAFERMDVDTADADAIWDDFAELQEGGSVAEHGDTVYAEVSKHSYCEQCEWFSDPIDVSCTHEGTEIIEFLDMETVRVMNCPVVAERRALEEEN